MTACQGSSRVFVSLGSNMNREGSIRRAVAALSAQYTGLTLSPVYETEAVGFRGDDFYNLVVAFDTSDDVYTLNSRLHEIERACGRERGSKKFSARTMDIDLLLYGDLVINEAGLCLPREEILRYAFVLVPLARIAGCLRHPLDGRSYAELWSVFQGDGGELHEIPFVWE